MSLSRLDLLILLCLIVPFITGYSLSVTWDKATINLAATYTFTFTFPNNNMRNITLKFPPSSDISSHQAYINNAATPLPSSSIIPDLPNRRLTINDQTPQSNILTIKVSNIINPPSASYFEFETIIVPAQSLASTLVPYINYERGNLLSCNWKFGNFTGSVNSIAEVDIVLGDKLLVGNNKVSIQFPNLFEDSDSKFLTLNSNPVITYSLNGLNFLTPVSSSSGYTKIDLTINLATQLAANSHLFIKLDGIVNPPTQNPSGKNFVVSTFDKDNLAIDRSVQCKIAALSVLQLTGTFAQTSLKVNDLYPTPKINVNPLIPFTVFQGDSLQLQHNQALKITTTSSLEISFKRGTSTVPFYVDNTITSTSTIRYFKGTIDNANDQSSSEIMFRFDINAPFSEKVWDFTITLKRTSGAYVRIKAILKASAISADPSKLSIFPSTTEMSLNSDYTLTVTLQRAISRNGKVLLGFSSDYIVAGGSCKASIQGINITSSSTCELLSRVSSQKWLSFKIGETSTSVINAGSQISIFYPSALIKNPIYMNTYSFKLQVYYTELDDSLVEKAEGWGAVTTTTHTNTKTLLITNDFAVYKDETVTLSYTNEVFIPANSIVQVIMPSEVYSIDFAGKVNIAGTDTTNILFDKNLPGGKTLQVTLRQDLPLGTTVIIPVIAKMPSVTGSYPTIVFKVKSLTAVYEQVISGLIIRVRDPSTLLSVFIQPRTSGLIDATTDYTIRILSQVPLPSIFLVTVTLPPQVQVNDPLSCFSNKGVCSGTIKSASNAVTFQLSSNPYGSTVNIQDFQFYVSTFTNPRYQGSTSLWSVNLKASYNGVPGSISSSSTTSDNYMYSSAVSCQLDPSRNYFKANTESIKITCNFYNNLVMNDFIYMTFSYMSYRRDTTPFTCSSISPVLCEVYSSSPTTLVLKITAQQTFVSNKRQIILEIGGLISYESTSYNDGPSPIFVERFDGSILKNPIDKGVFNYDISCNEDDAIRAKTCKTCSNGNCSLCYPTMFKASNNSCVNDCPMQTQFRALNNLASSQCQPCTLPCYTCQLSASRCLSCLNSSYYLNRQSYTCDLTCNTSNSFWINSLDPNNKICQPCLTQCLKCYNSNFDGCIQCKSGYVLQNGYCRTSCLTQRSYVYNGVCYQCDVACQNCTGIGANSCGKCKMFYYLNNGYCVEKCPINKYTLSNDTCGCLGQCATCTTTSPTQCTTCLSSTDFLFNSTCLSACPPYTYSLLNQCLDCPQNCIQCANSNTCTKCASNYFSYESKCYFDCNTIGYQYDKKDGYCVLCPTGCDTCDGTLCTSCLEDYTKNATQCIKNCMITNSCTVKNPVPQKIMPFPGTLAMIAWLGIVFAAKFFNSKLYVPYSAVFLTAVIQFILIIATTIYAKSLIAQVPKRLLQIDITQRPSIFYLLIVALVLNYVSNICYGIIFCKYLFPLMKSPRQVDYITIGLALTLGMATNYRFCLVVFSKMFPKPYIETDLPSQLTPVHYLCIGSVLLSGFSIGAASLMIKNEYPLTDLFMLGVDILIIEFILIIFSVWMVACQKSKEYYQSEIKKYHLEEFYKTQGQLNQKDQKENSKHQIKDQFEEDRNSAQDQAEEITHQNHLLQGQSTLKTTTHALVISDQERQRPLSTKPTKKSNLEVLNIRNKVENSFDSIDFSEDKKDTKKKKNKNQNDSSDKGDLNLESKKKMLQRTNSQEKNLTLDKKFETDDDNNLPKTIQPVNSNIFANIHEPSSDELPNLPLTNSVFHERSSSEFSKSFRPKQSLRNMTQRSDIIKNKSPLKKTSDNKDPDQINKTQRSQSKVNMKKTNKFFESQVDQQENSKKQAVTNRKKDGFQDLDLQQIIKSKIVVIQSKDQKYNQKDGTSVGDSNNISLIHKRQQQNSDFNQQVSPSWFNIQNQRIDFSSFDDDFSQN